jgi:hypothetical protein
LLRRELEPESGHERVRDGPAVIYVIDGPHGVKIGVTDGTVKRRISQISRACGLPMSAFHIFHVYSVYTYATALVIERAAIESLREKRTVGEWFDCHPFEVADAIERAFRTEDPLVQRLVA